MNTRTYLLATLVGALAVAAPGCGDSAECGPFTTSVDGVCVIDDLCPDGQAWDDAAEACVGANNCATGTVEDGSGNCVPDFGNICTGQTVLDPATGECVLDPTACGTDTTLVGGVCITVDDSLVPDVTEPPEPNGIGPTDTPGTFTLPPNTGDTVTIKVTSNPYEDVDSDGILDGDLDAFFTQATGPGRYMVRVDALNGGGVGGSLILAIPGNRIEDWRRFGISNTQDWSEREVFLPEAGNYAFIFSDTRSLVTGFGAGSPESDMFITITKMADPTPTALTTNATTGDLEAIANADGTVQCFNADINAFDILFTSVGQDAPIDSLNLGMVVLTAGNPSHGVEEGAGGIGATSGAPAMPTLLACIDPVWNYGFPVGNNSYVATITNRGAPALPDNGDSVTFPFTDGENNFGHFAGEADSVHRFQMTSAADAINVLIVTPSFQVIFSATGVTDVDEFLLLKETGTYYVQFFNQDGVDGTTFDLSFTRAAIVPSALALGTPLAAQTMDVNHNRDFFVVDFASSEWFEMIPTLTAGFTGDLSVNVYPYDVPGALDTGITPADNLTTADGGNSGRVNLGATGFGQMLISITDDGGADGDETYDLDLRERAHTTHAVVPGTPVSDVMTLAADANGYFLITYVVADTGELQVTATGTAPAVGELTILDREGGTVDTSTDAALLSVIPSGGWAAGMVNEMTGLAGDITLDINALPPNLVTIVGDMGVTLPPITSQDDGLSTGAVTLPFAFNIGGTAVTEFSLDSNGRMIFIVDFWDTGASNNTPLGIPDAGADFPYIAMPWGDHDAMVFYIKSEATQLTVEMIGLDWWTGNAIHSQVILHDDNTMDFVMGIDHVDNCDTTLGLQEDATTGLELTFGTCNSFTAPNAATTVNAATLTVVP